MGTGCNDFDQNINEEEKVPNDGEDLETFTTEGLKMLVEATKKSNSLPQGKARDLYESCPSFHTIMEKQADHVLSMLAVMLKHTIPSKSLQKKDDDDKLEMIVDSNDTLLENVGILLDELSGIRKNPETTFITQKVEPVSGSWNDSRKRKVGSLAATQVLNNILNQTKNIEKPQLKFKDKVNNDSNTPFEPRIKYKYNMLKPLAFVSEIDEYGISHFSHPYEFELEKFTPPPELLVPRNPVKYKSMEETPLVFVTTPEDVPKMVEDLEKYKEIAVDLEHHSYRSFQGFTCLLQISTRDTDYIIDALSLRSDLELLNKAFTNPGIVKVFHGGDLDILWLQRDLAIYVVNMFDTHQASKMLNFPKLSLAYLLSHFCSVYAQKQYQLADWRVRPLPQELITYARGDTHYLLYIYDNLRNCLIEKSTNESNLLKFVINESTKICLKRYSKPIYEPDGYLDIYRRSKKLFDNRQKFALQRLYEWRDTVARQLDESYAYVLPDHMMLNISEVLPREAQGILACCNPIPLLVRQNLLTLHQIILKAREQQLVQPILEEQRFYKYTSSVTSLDNPLQRPHDLNHEGEFRDDLPVLLGGSNDVNLDKKSLLESNFYCSKPLINVFENSPTASENAERLLAANKAILLTPYQRYKLSKKYSESVEVKSLDANENQKSEKENESATASGEKESDNQIEETKDNPSESTEDSAKMVLEDTNTAEQTSKKKRKLEENSEPSEEPSKKLKTEVSSSNNTNTSSEQEKSNSGKKSKKKKKNKALQGSKEKEFEPFDFKSVDFKRYQTSAVNSKKKVQEKSSRKRGKKSGKKNFKISI